MVIPMIYQTLLPSRELNHDISKTTLSLDHSTIEPDKEVKQLITEELPEEEDDEEYSPDNDEEYQVN